MENENRTYHFIIEHDYGIEGSGLISILCAVKCELIEARVKLIETKYKLKELQTIVQMGEYMKEWRGLQQKV